MADRRMFNKVITEADPFTEMPPTTQCLYFHLCMTADDDGFSNKIRQALFNAHATTDDFNTLVNKKFIIPFESGVIVIKHWRIHNYIRSDRYKETGYLEEKAQLLLKDNDAYTLSTVGIPMVDQMETQYRLGKDSIGKDSIGKDIYNDADAQTIPEKPKKEPKHKHGEYNHVLLTDSQYNKLLDDFGEDWLNKAIKILDEYMQSSGRKYKDCNLVLRGWVKNRIEEDEAKFNYSFRSNNKADNLLEEMKSW